MGRFKTAATIVAMLGCVACVSQREGWSNPQDVANGCTTDIEPESGSEIGKLQIVFAFDAVKTNDVALTIWIDSTPNLDKPVYIGGIKAQRGKSNTLEISKLDSMNPKYPPVAKLNGTKVGLHQSGLELARYASFGLQADIQDKTRILLRLHKQAGIVLEITTTAPGAP